MQAPWERLNQLSISTIGTKNENLTNTTAHATMFITHARSLFFILRLAGKFPVCRQRGFSLYQNLHNLTRRCNLFIAHSERMGDFFMYTVRLALNFEVVAENDSVAGYGRPQDFRVKKSYWQKSQATIFIDDTTYEVFIYARKWLGNGSDFTELQHDNHPSVIDMCKMMWKLFAHEGLPTSNPFSPQVSPSDPLRMDDILDPTDNPDEFLYEDVDGTIINNKGVLQ